MASVVEWLRRQESNLCHGD